MQDETSKMSDLAKQLQHVRLYSYVAMQTQNKKIAFGKIYPFTQIIMWFSLYIYACY